MRYRIEIWPNGGDNCLSYITEKGSFTHTACLTFKADENKGRSEGHSIDKVPIEELRKLQTAAKSLYRALGDQIKKHKDYQKI